MLRMHGFATPVKPWGRRWCSFCQKNSEQSTDWELGAHLEAAVTWSWEARSSQATSFSCSEEKVRIFVWALRINCTYLTHLSQDQKSVRRGSKEGRLGDVLVFFLELVIGRSVEPSSFLFVLSNVAILLPLMRNFLLRCSDIPKGFLQTISSLNY